MTQRLALLVLPFVLLTLLGEGKPREAAASEPVQVLYPHPATTPMPVYPPAVEQWRALVADRFGEHASEAMAVMACESDGDPKATGDGGNSIGLFQLAWGNIHGRWEYPEGIRAAAGVPHDLTRREAVSLLEDPWWNAEIAYWTFQLRGERWNGDGGWGCAP